MIRRLKTSCGVAVIVAALMSTPASAFAGLKAILGIDIGDSGSLILRLDSNTYCGTAFAIVSRNEPYYNDMYAMALTAQATNKPVNVYVGSCDSQGKAQIVRMVTGSVF